MRRIVDVKKEAGQGLKITLDAGTLTGKIRVIAIAPGSPAIGLLALSDSLLEVNGTKVRSCAQAAGLIKRAERLQLVVVAQPRWPSLGAGDAIGTSAAAAGARMAPCASETKRTGRDMLLRDKSEMTPTPRERAKDDSDSEEPVSTLPKAKMARPAPKIKCDIIQPATPPSRRVVRHLCESNLDQRCDNGDQLLPSPPISKRSSLAPPPRHRCAPVVPATSLGERQPALTLSAAKAATALAVDLSSATDTAASLAAAIEPDALLDPTTPPSSRRVVRRFNASNLDACCRTDEATPPSCALVQPRHRRAPVVRTLAEAGAER